MKKLLATLMMSVVCTAAVAQVGTTMKEGAKATGEKAEQYGDQAKGAVSTQPSKTVDKAKAQVHKAKAHAHAKAAKDAAKDVQKEAGRLCFCGPGKPGPRAGVCLQVWG
jgi:hypothetical protein